MSGLAVEDPERGGIVALGGHPIRRVDGREEDLTHISQLSRWGVSLAPLGLCGRLCPLPDFLGGVLKKYLGERKGWAQPVPQSKKGGRFPTRFD